MKAAKSVLNDNDNNDATEAEPLKLNEIINSHGT